MKKGTVRRRIFVSDTAMVLATLFLFLLVNLLVLKIYSEAIEKAFLDSAEQIANAQELEELLKQRILYQNKFLLLTAAVGGRDAGDLHRSAHVHAGVGGRGHRRRLLARREDLAHAGDARVGAFGRDGHHGGSRIRRKQMVA